MVIMENEKNKNTNNFKIIPSVKEVKYLKKAIQSDNLCIQLTGVHIGNLQQLSHICHQAGKTVIVNHELVDGLGKDRIAFQMLKKLYHVDGIIGSSITKLHMMKGLNVKVIYRITLMDSISVDNALKTINEVKFDAIELRPYYHAIEFLPTFKKVWDGEYYVAGFVNTEEKLISDNNYIDTYKLGNNEVNINYLNSENKKKKYKVTYEIVDTTKPIILLSSSITAYKGNNVNLVNKAICADNYDKKPNCYIEGDYDINKVGKYNLKYIAIDSNNNKNEKKFVLNVKEKKKSNNNTSTSRNKYLIKDLIKEHKNDKTMIGIDVSSWQGNVDFKKVKDAGVEFVIIRIGFGHKNGEIVYDNRFNEYLKNAKANSLKVGLYFYSYAKNIKESNEQAKWIIKELNGETLDLPIAFDWEIFSGFNNYNLSLTDLNLIGESFIKEINNAGYEGMLYSSKYYLENMWNLNEYKTWLAHYIDKTNYKGEYYIWQLSNTGKVDGINGDVDLDILFLK